MVPAKSYLSERSVCGAKVFSFKRFSINSKVVRISETVPYKAGQTPACLLAPA